MEPLYAERYRELALRHWWWRARNDAVRREIDRLLGGRRDASILDVGCGDGVLFDFLARFGSVEGVEPDPAVVSPDSRWRGRIQLRPFDTSFAPGRRYDLILMLDVLEHFEDPVTALRHAAGLLEERGTMLVTVPAFRTLWTHHDDLNRHFHRFTKPTLRAVTEQAGLHVEQEWYLFQWLFFAKIVQRAREWIAGPSPPEVVPGDAVNDFLFKLSTAEQRAVGRKMPFGSSLLAIIRKADGSLR